MRKCYGSETDGSVSRRRLHAAYIDPTAPAHARCRKTFGAFRAAVVVA